MMFFYREITVCAVAMIICVIACVTDMRKMTIPDELTGTGIVLGMAATLVWDMEPIPKLVCFGLIILIGPFIFAGGDCKLCIAFSLLTGWKMFVLCFVAAQVLVIGSIILVYPVYIYRDIKWFMSGKGKKLYGREYLKVPFAPALLSAYMVTAFVLWRTGWINFVIN